MMGQYRPPAPPVPGIVVRPHSRGGEYEVGHVGPYLAMVKSGYQCLPCDGRPYDPSVYRELAAAIGDDFGWKNGKPCLPDIRNASMAVPPRR